MAIISTCCATTAPKSRLPGPCPPAAAQHLLALFNGSRTDEEERQRAAVCQAVGKRLMVLTGGPGTGKTTTVLRMLLGLSREHAAVNGRLPLVRIAAPTGKAAQRLAAALLQGKTHLCEGTHPIGSAWMPHLEAVVAAESGTVHRLLGSRGRHGGYGFHAGERLPADIVVVDEASMLDLGLLRALLAALRDEAVLVLVGDADQLTSVDPRGDLVRLVHCFRAERRLVPINEAVRAGEFAGFADAAAAAGKQVAAAGHPGAVIHEVADAGRLRQRLRAWAERLQRSLAAVDITRPVAAGDQEALARRLDVLRRQHIAARLRGWDALEPWEQGAWYPGRSVIITRNDSAARLYNGDVGLCVLVARDGAEPLLQVAFEGVHEAAASPGAEAARVRLFDTNALPAHEDAFALTVHKSQGSEYDHVAVLLPPEQSAPLLARQMLYTGLSRARLSVELWATDASLRKAIEKPMLRHGRLAERIESRSGR